MIGRNEDVNIETSLHQMLLPSDTSLRDFSKSREISKESVKYFFQLFFCLEFQGESK